MLLTFFTGVIEPMSVLLDSRNCSKFSILFPHCFLPVRMSEILASFRDLLCLTLLTHCLATSSNEIHCLSVHGPPSCDINVHQISPGWRRK